MKHNRLLFPVIILTLVSCEALFPESAPEPSNEEVFEELWKTFDEKYVCFPVKDLDWKGVHDEFKQKLKENMNEEELYIFLSSMLDTLADGHVSLASIKFDYSVGRSYLRKRNENMNINFELVYDKYLREYKRAGGFKYNTLSGWNVGYISYYSFAEDITVEQIEEVLDTFSGCDGIVFDIRSNEGGTVFNIMNICEFLPFSSGQKLYDVTYRSGSGHDDFCMGGSTYAPKITSGHRIYDKPFIVLIDGASFSASSVFALCSRKCSNVKLVGTTTGGGTSFPEKGELQNGWRYNLPASRIIATDGRSYETGVSPDYEIKLDSDAVAEGKDNIIEFACNLIHELND